MSDLCRRSFIGVCRGSVSVSDLWRRSYIGVCRGSVCVSDLCRRSYIGVCRGSVSVSDPCRRSYFGVCRSVRVSSKSVLQECQVRVSEKKYQARVSYKSVK